MNEPKIALASPPPSAFGGGVISVKSVRALMPPHTQTDVSNRIQISQKMPNAIAASDSVSAIDVHAACGAWSAQPVIAGVAAA